MKSIIENLPISDIEKKELLSYLEDPVKKLYVQEELTRIFKEFQAQEKNSDTVGSIKKIYQKFEHVLKIFHDFYEQLRVVKVKRLSLEEKIQKKEDSKKINKINSLIDNLPE